MSLPAYAVDFRGFPACPCQAAWLPVFEDHLRARGIIDHPLPIAQLIGGFAASGGTHVDGGASDLIYHGAQAEAVTAEARQMGADPTWHRLAGWDNGGGIEHVHSVLRGCPHLSPSAEAQIIAVDHDGDGLGGTTTPDPGPRPLSGRTWREGIAWAQQEDWFEMATKDDLRAVVREELAAAVPTPKQIANAVWAYAVNKSGIKAKAVLSLLYDKNKKKEVQP
jgi:hypothetical protein